MATALRNLSCVCILSASMMSVARAWSAQLFGVVRGGRESWKSKTSFRLIADSQISMQ